MALHLLPLAVLLALACGGTGEASTPPPSVPAADAGPGGGGGAGESSNHSCATSLQATGGRWQFSEQCTDDDRTSSRTCTRRGDATEWRCACTAPDGQQATCTAPADPAVVTAPEPCCPPASP